MRIDPGEVDSGRVAAKPTNKSWRPLGGAGGAGGAGDQGWGTRISKSTHRHERAREFRRWTAHGKPRKGQSGVRDSSPCVLHHINADTPGRRFTRFEARKPPVRDVACSRYLRGDPRIEEICMTGPPGSLSTAPSRRRIPKADGKKRLLAIAAALEDKVRLCGATVMALNAIYEGDFCGFLVAESDLARAVRCADRYADGDQNKESELDT